MYLQRIRLLTRQAFCVIKRVPPARVEAVEPRTLMTAYYVDSDTALAAVNLVNLAAGDQVLLKGGSSFNGSLSFDANDQGTAADPILVTSYDATTGLAIDAASPASARATLRPGAGYGITALDTAGIDVVALNLVGSGVATNAGSGIQFSNDLPGDVKLDHVTIDSVDVSGFRGYGIELAGAAGKSGFSNVRITNSSLHDNGQGGIVSYGVYSATPFTYAHTNIYVGHVTAYNNAGIANFSSHSGNGVVIGDVDGAVIEYSQAYNNGALNTHNGGPIGIWTYDSNNVVIQYNESHHNHTNSSTDGGGFDLDGGVTNSVMQYNYSHDNDGAGYGLFQYAGARPWHDNTVRFNLSVNDGRKNAYGGISVWNVGSGIGHAEIYNNTVVMNSTLKKNAPWAVSFLTGGTSSIHFRNNNLVTSGKAGMVFLKDARKHTGLLFQGNNYYASGSFLIDWSGRKYGSMVSWRRTANQETLPGGTYAGLSINPQFVNGSSTTADGYKLLSTSPLAKSGLNLLTLFGIDPGTQDLYGPVAPTATTFSIGADWVA